jgi:hypothetical protein
MKTPLNTTKFRAIHITEIPLIVSVDGQNSSCRKSFYESNKAFKIIFILLITKLSKLFSEVQDYQSEKESLAEIIIKYNLPHVTAGVGNDLLQLSHVLDTC